MDNSVRLVYFEKESGKFICGVRYNTKHNYTSSIRKEILEMRDNNKLPGLPLSKYKSEDIFIYAECNTILIDNPILII